ncbi:MAG: OmpA family protein [Mucilaginibacter sp.]|uniref:OmpA family protein n=1 Tax=Mucilaginibacter sp. TaxID=1882438 RepID=UPI00319FACAB
MKTNFFPLALFALMLISIEANANINPPKPVYKSTTPPKRAMTIAELTGNLQFDFGKADIRIKYDDQLDQLAKMLIDKNYSLALRGHADSIGTYVGNWKLSDKRANRIKDYLVKKGVSAEKIVTTPFGSTMPIASNKTPEGRQKNRRVEVRINAINNTLNTSL